VIGKKKNVVINGILEAYLKAYPHKRPVLKAIDNNKCKVIKKTTNTKNDVCYENSDSNWIQCIVLGWS
jgi:hypothetical protein